jgi:hypothetical protein
MHLTQLFHYSFANWGAFTQHKMFLGSIWQSIQQKKRTKAYGALKALIMHNISIDSIGLWFQMISYDRKNKKQMTT